MKKFWEDRLRETAVDNVEARAKMLERVGMEDFELGDKDRAMELFHQALEILTEKFGPQDHRLVHLLTSLGLYSRNDDPTSAKEWLERSLTLNHEHLSPGIPWRSVVDEGAPLTAGLKNEESSNILKFLGVAYKNLGDFENAKKMLETHVRIFDSVKEPNDPDFASALKILGDVYTLLYERANARRVLERALRIQEQWLGPESLRVARVMDSLSFIEAQEGNAERAIALLERVVPIFEKELWFQHSELRMDSDTFLAKMRLKSLKEEVKKQTRKL